jgi:flagellar biosynthetic protein FliS
MLKAQDAIRAKDREASFHALDRAQSIVLELGNGLRREANPELVDQIVGLHMFVYRRLIVANMEQDLTALEEALSILRHQRETWVLLMQKVTEARAGFAPGDPATQGRPLTAPRPEGAPAAASTSGFVADNAAGSSGFVAEA